MTTTQCNPDSTTDRRQADCRCPDDRCAGHHHEVGETCPCTRALDAEVERLIASVKVIDGGEKAAPWETIPWEDGEAIIDRFAVMSEDGTELTIYRTTPIEILDQTYGHRKAISADSKEWIVRNTIERYVYGKLGEARTFWSLGGVSDLTADLNAEIKHPSWCRENEREYCWAKTLKSNVEHASETERTEGADFIASATLELIVGSVDYRYEPDPLTAPRVEIDAPGRGATTLTLEPSDLSKLGKFLIAQAERFTSMMREAGAAA